jgi:GNAT superfamily N-acetyltransferase
VDARPPGQLRIVIARAAELGGDTIANILALAHRAYGRDLSSYYFHFSDPTHVIGYVDGTIVTHALWVTRWLQVLGGRPMRTAYVEMVATEPVEQRRGFAAAVMRALVDAVQDYDFAALCPDDRAVHLYEGLGWRFWEGALAIRTDEGLLPTPTERVMFLVLPRTPHLDRELPLSAEWRPDDLW